jgi:Fe-S-cluster containining protein
MDTPLDYSLLAHFRFRCLPGCGLCCYTTPAVAPEERSRLIQLDPTVPLLETSDGWAQIASRPNGGACHFLQAERCGCHAARPATCAEFPLTVHVSHRAQVSVVLTCPGLDLTDLPQWGHGNRGDRVGPDFRHEVHSVELEVRRAAASGQMRRASQRHQTVQRRLRRKGSWQTEAEVRTRLQGRLDEFIPTELATEERVGEADDLESLPLFYDPMLGRVAWRSAPGGVEFLVLGERGGISKHLEVLDVPNTSPGLEESSRMLMRGYLGYLLERDATISAAYEYLLEGEPELPETIVAEDLQKIAGQVLRLATLRRALTSDRRGPLSALDIENGIRATDMDILDRPTTGVRL